MKPAPWQSDPNFLALQRKWDSILDGEGLKLEFGRSVSDVLWGFRHNEQYYRLAGWWTHDKTDWGETELRVWRRHAEGIAYRKIAKELKVSLDFVVKVVHANARQMKEEYCG